MTLHVRPWSFAALILSLLSLPAMRARAQEPIRPTFRSSVDMVSITAVVRDRRSRTVRDLQPQDFEVLEQGAPRRIVQFSGTHEGPVTIAFVFDTSGSMGLAANLAKGREVITELVARLDQSRDEMALFTFHKTLQQEVAFTTDREEIYRALDGVRPWGLTSLFDAIADTARQLHTRAAERRAVVVLSDGLDTSSRLSAEQVARLSSEIDVPVYVVAVISPLEHPARQASTRPPQRPATLTELADLTGGDVFYVSGFEASTTAATLLAAVRHQYVLAIEATSAQGRYALEVKTKRKGLHVRARRAYWSDSR
jgi:Ca-activated chloride channel family protein